MKVKTKVKSVQANGSYESKYGAEQPDGKKLMFKFEYEFEDGKVLDANHKTKECPFNVGDEVEYEVTRSHETYGDSGKVSKPSEFNQGSQKSGDYVKGIEVGHSINNGVLLTSGLGMHPHLTNPTIHKYLESIELYARDILTLAEKLKNE